MRAMKDSGIEWIGEIPADWTLQRGKTIFAQRLTKGNQSEILLAATQKYGMLPQLEVEGVVQVKEDADLQQFRTVHKKDFVISLRSFQGGFEYSQYEGVCSPAYQVFYNTTPICHNYYRLLFKSDGFIQKMNSMTVGIREGKNIQYSDFANSLIPVPSIDQQHHIADYLDRKCSQIDAIIARQQEVIEKLKAYKLSVITEAVTKGLNPHVPMKDSGVEWIGEIPEDWRIVKTRYTVKDIGDIDHYMPESVVAGIPYLMTGDLKDFASEVDFDSCKQVATDDYLKLSKKVKVEKGDLIFARYATIGTVCLVDTDKDFLVSYSCVIVKVDPNLIESKFLMYYYKSTAFLEEILKFSNANTQSNIGKDSMYKAKICIPPIKEQKEIIRYLEKKCSRVELLLKSKQAVIDKLTEYKKSLIYEVVTGKKEV